MSNMARTVSDALFRHHLEGFKGYPRERDAKFLEVFNECCLSVDHARAVLDSFTVAMPTLQDIKDTAWNLRERFEAHEPEQKRWQREYGPPDPNWTRNLIGSYAQQKAKMQWQAIRDAVYYTEGPGRLSLERIADPEQRRHDQQFWSRQAIRIRQEHAELLAIFRQELSRGWDDLMKEDWVNEAPAVAVAPQPSSRPKITQADFDALKTDEDEDRWE
jgi:hypothetical protein